MGPTFSPHGSPRIITYTLGLVPDVGSLGVVERHASTNVTNSVLGLVVSAGIAVCGCTSGGHSRMMGFAGQQDVALVKAACGQ
jgi:hypothetical protein